MNTPFLGMNLREHVAQFERAARGAWKVVIWAGDGMKIATQADVGRDIARGVIASRVSLPPDEVRDLDLVDHHVRIYPIRDHLKNPLAAVLIYGESGSFSTSSLELLDVLIDAFSRETRLNMELSQMADELNRRHEELNLIFSTNSSEEEHGDEDILLANTVELVLEHMDGDVVLLTVPTRHIWILATAAKNPVWGRQIVLRKVEAVALEWMRRQGKPLVSNTPAEAAEELSEIWPMRSLFVPVRDDQDQIIGSLALCRSQERPRLMNSDKNLLLALSERLGKVIQHAFDNLTGLPKRARFERLLDRSLGLLDSSARKHALVYLNVDGLGAVNEQYGMRAGDNALQLVAAQLRVLGRSNDVCARVGGDEFALLLLDCSEEVAIRKARELQDVLARQNFMLGKTRHILRVSVGVVEVHKDLNAGEAMTKASVVCAIAKEAGGNAVEAYGSALQKVTRKREEVRVLTQVRQAIEEDRFELHAQDIAPLLSVDSAPHFEVLLRLRDEDGKMVPPIEFIPVAEKHNLMPVIDRWVIRNTMKELRASGVLQAFPGTVCSINLSGQSFAAGSVLEDLERMIREQNVPPENLCFEVTETAAIADLASAQYHISRVRRLGCRFALDDFGAGLSSFSYLRTLPLDYVKIDGSFVRDMCKDNTAKVMVMAIHNVSHSMNLQTVAEYVEDDSIVAELREIGVDYGQGYGIGKPVPMREYIQSRLTSSVRRHG
jgi:diguanylate cyclase (GGDEF)-like protein